MIDPVDIVLAGIAIFSAIFVAITGGLKITVGYRGSKETLDRKRRIDEKLQEQVKTAMLEFISDCTSKKFNDKKIHDKFEDLGYKAYVSRNLTTDILESLTRFMERGIKMLVLATCTLVVTLFVVSYYSMSESLEWLDVLILLIYIVATIFFYWKGVSLLRKNYTLRKFFIWVNENPTIDNAIEARVQLVDRELL